MFGCPEKFPFYYLYHLGKVQLSLNPFGKPFKPADGEICEFNEARK